MSKEEFVQQYVLARAGRKEELNPTLAAERAAEAWEKIHNMYGGFPVSRLDTNEKKNG